MSIFKRWRSQSSHDPARQPLLSPSKRADSEHDGLEVREVPPTTPLPYKQVVVLCFMRITEPISQSLIHPFINQMLEDLHVTPDRTKIGYYAGIITTLIPMCNAVGIIIGPLIGGYLAKPATQYPEYFGKIEFLIDYPYFLPCFIAGMINLLAVIVGFFFLDETLPSKKRTRNLPLDNDSDEDVDDVASETGEIVTEPKPKFSALFTPTVISVLLGSLLVFFQMSSLATLIPLFAYTRFEDGGLGLNLRQMGRHGPYYQRLCRSDCLDGHVPLSAEKMGDDEAFPVGSVNLADGFCALTLGSLVGRGEEGVLRNRSRLQGRYDRLDLRVGGQKLR
ncbi:hypothetical protein PSHT_06002 [Puccinia striiformis]|uniref:Major facilitator superfamily (MFS) profile domain-containing protein n=1 Tax=Puccinia striiformis TaxID=27350 RepID=A0A2S4W907_9BASI|nr:hypothetical protein PSHT_06002 [Puccinia striiformis]